MSGSADQTWPPSSRRGRGVSAHLAAMQARRERFRRLHDFSNGVGLEIGPLDSAIATSEDAEVRYLDVQDTTATRAHYAHDPGVLVELIPEIDYTLDDGQGRIRSLVEATAAGAPYDWVIASHVVEHVPDLVTWLLEVAEVTADGGALILAVPDRRFCFDVHRPPTTTGQVLAAHDSRDTRPSVRAVYDYLRSAVNVDPAALRRGLRPPGRDARIHGLPAVLERVARARSGEYVDSHVWTFTPDEFVDQLRELRALDLCWWYVEKLEEPGVGTEFHAVLRRLPRAASPSTAPVDEPGAGLDMPGWLDEVAGLRERVRRLERQLRRSRVRTRTLERRVADLEGSTRMRVGRAVVAPAVAVRRTVRSALARGRSRGSA